MIYKKKPVIVDAFHFGIDEEPAWFHKACRDNIVVTSFYGVNICTSEGIIHANEGDYIIKGVNGEIYPCKANIFCQTYEKIE